MRWLDRYRALIAGLGGLVGICFGAIAVLIPLDMLLRAVGIGNLPWLSEVVEYTIFTGVFLAAPWVLAENGHVRVDLLSAALAPASARLLELALAAVGFAICVGFIAIAVLGGLDAYEFGASIRRTLVIPEWWLLGIFAISMTLMAIEFVIRFHLIRTDMLPASDVRTDGL